jgi:hypothetical protein
MPHALRQAARCFSSGAIIVPMGIMGRIVSLIEQRLLKPLLAKSFSLVVLGKALEGLLVKK